MNRILLRESELSEGILHLVSDDYRARHLRQILKARVGQSFEAGILHGTYSGNLEILQINDDAIKLRFLGENDPQQRLRWQNLSLAIGVPRPPVLKRLLCDLASAGLREIALIQGKLCESDYRKSHVWDELEHYLILGAEQGRIQRLPKLYLSSDRRGGMHLRDYLSLARQLRAHRSILPQNCIVLDEQGPRRTPGPDEWGTGDESQESQPYLIALGPERGWTAVEQKAFQAADFVSCSLGPMTLRTEVSAHLAVGLYLWETQRICSQ